MTAGPTAPMSGASSTQWYDLTEEELTQQARAGARPRSRAVRAGARCGGSPLLLVVPGLTPPGCALQERIWDDETQPAKCRRPWADLGSDRRSWAMRNGFMAHLWDAELISVFVGEALGHEPVEAEPGSPSMRGAMAMRSPRPHSSAPTLQEIERGLSLPPAVINSTGPPKKSRPKRREQPAGGARDGAAKPAGTTAKPATTPLPPVHGARAAASSPPSTNGALRVPSSIAAARSAPPVDGEKEIQLPAIVAAAKKAAREALAGRHPDVPAARYAIEAGQGVLPSPYALPLITARRKGRKPGGTRSAPHQRRRVQADDPAMPA